MKEPKGASRTKSRFLTLHRVLTLSLLAGGTVAVVAIPPAREFFATSFRLLANSDVTEGISDLAEFLKQYGDRAWIFTSALMILALAVPIPAIPIVIVNALLYGPWLGTLISWSSAQVAAAMCFFLSRALGRHFVERFIPAKSLEKLDGFFAREGALAVLVLRLIPYVSFDAVGYAAGLTSMKFLPFIVATGLGQLPAATVYSFAGANIVDEPGHALRIALVFLSVMAVVGALVWWKVRARRRARGGASTVKAVR